MGMRWLLLAGLVSSACSPEIGKGTYFCGPERFCPPDMECDDPSYTCDSPRISMLVGSPEGCVLSSLD